MSIRTSEQTEQLDEAFAKAQAKFTSAKKSTEGQIGTRKYKYADISEIIDAMMPFLNAEGISVRQHPGFEYRTMEGGALEPFMTVTTRITYKGQWEESDISLPAISRNKFEGERFDAQSCGSALTYACRYGLQGIGVISREDDDGAAASGRGTHEEAQAVGKTKIEALKAAKAQQDPSKGPDQLVCYPASNDTFEVTGDPPIMNAHAELLRAYGKITSKQPPIVTMTAEGLDAFKHEFCDNRNGILVSLKARKMADAAMELKKAFDAKG